VVVGRRAAQSESAMGTSLLWLWRRGGSYSKAFVGKTSANCLNYIPSFIQCQAKNVGNWKGGGPDFGFPDRARYCSGVKKATTKAKQMPRDPTSACDRRVAFLLAPTEGQQMGLIQPYARVKSGSPVIDLRAAVMAGLAGARPGAVGRTRCAPAAVARGVTWPSAGGSYRRWNCATRPGPRRNRNTPGSRWTSSIPHTGSGFGPRQGAESEGVHGVFYLRGRPEVASSPCPVLARVAPKAQCLPTSCCAFGIINRGDARESYTEAQDSWITPDMLGRFQNIHETRNTSGRKSM